VSNWLPAAKTQQATEKKVAASAGCRLDQTSLNDGSGKMKKNIKSLYQA
jgi:hypothetical protein